MSTEKTSAQNTEPSSVSFGLYRHELCFETPSAASRFLNFLNESFRGEFKTQYFRDEFERPTVGLFDWSVNGQEGESVSYGTAANLRAEFLLS